MAHAPRDWKSRAPRPLPNSLTFSQQDSLPRLPVPELDVTLAKLEKSLRPLARSPAELETARRKIAKLGEEGGLGRILHSRLLEYASDPKRVNWLEEFWDDAAYLTYRDSIVVNVSYYYGFTPHPAHLPQTPTHRAAAITRSALLFRRALKRGEIEPDRVKDGAHCMDSWRWMFDCARVPGLDSKDFSVTAAVPGDDGVSDTPSAHVVFIRNSRVWKVPATVVDSETNERRIISTGELEAQIQHIYDNSTSEHPPVGYLPAQNRDLWANDYALLSAIPRNREILDALESCAFVVSLDAEKPEGPVEFSRAGWHGGVEGGQMGSRWVDKPCQFIIWDNGKAALAGEHSVMDGTPTARMAGQVVEAIKSPTFDNGPSPPSSSSLPPPQPLDWSLTPTLHASITRAKSATHALVTSQSLTYLRTSYGKAAIKKMGFSPDSYTQMIIQLAYHRLINHGRKDGEKVGRIGGTYEAATTRKFAHGRTEAIRVVSEESEKWVAAMDKFSRGDAGVSAEEVKELFAAAVKTHGADARAAGNAQGVDRHIFGLKKMLKPDESAPELFSDPLMNRSNYWVLSTSAIHHPNFEVYGWGEVVPDGFGVAYVAGQDNFLQFTLTSRTEMPNAQFSAELNKASEDMLAIFTGEAKARL